MEYSRDFQDGLIQVYALPPEAQDVGPSQSGPDEGMEYRVPLGFLATIQKKVGLFFGEGSRLLMPRPWWIDQFRHVMFDKLPPDRGRQGRPEKVVVFD